MNKSTVKILLFGNPGNKFSELFIVNVKSIFPNVQVDIFSWSQLQDHFVTQSHAAKIFHVKASKNLPRVLRFLVKLGKGWRVLQQLKRQYHYVHIFGLSSYYNCFYAASIKKTSQKGLLNIRFFGSDFYRSTSLEKICNRRLLNRATSISVCTEHFISNIAKTYPEYAHKLNRNAFGLNYLDSLGECCDRYSTPPNAKIRVVCGHNASAGDQHILMIDAINKLPLHVRDQCQFIFPLTYGGDADKICQLLKKQSFESVSLTEMLIGQELYDFIASADIYINMQVSDHNSASMLELLYAGAVVLAGEWLPYGDLKDNGIFLIRYSYHDLSDFLQDVVINLKDYQEQCRVNRMLVDKNYSWSGVKDTWKHLYAYKF